MQHNGRTESNGVCLDEIRSIIFYNNTCHIHF